jgi:hypothetical protein
MSEMGKPEKFIAVHPRSVVCARGSCHVLLQSDLTPSTTLSLGLVEQLQRLELDPTTQTKTLHYVQDGACKTLGGFGTVIAAVGRTPYTNLGLEKAVSHRTWRWRMQSWGSLLLLMGSRMWHWMSKGLSKSIVTRTPPNRACMRWVTFVAMCC